MGLLHTSSWLASQLGLTKKYAVLSQRVFSIVSHKYLNKGLENKGGTSSASQWEEF